MSFQKHAHLFCEQLNMKFRSQRTSNRQEFSFHIEPHTTEDEYNDFISNIPLPSQLISKSDAMEEPDSDLLEQSINIYTAQNQYDEDLAKRMFEDLCKKEMDRQNTNFPKLLTKQLDEIAKKTNFLGGKFMLLFLSSSIVDSIFFQLLQFLVDGNGTRITAFKRTSTKFAVSFSTYDFTDEDDLNRIAEEIGKLFKVQLKKMYYKTDLYSALQLDSVTAPRFGLKASRFEVMSIE